VTTALPPKVCELVLIKSRSVSNESDDPASSLSAVRRDTNRLELCTKTGGDMGKEWIYKDGINVLRIVEGKTDVFFLWSKSPKRKYYFCFDGNILYTN